MIFYADWICQVTEKLNLSFDDSVSVHFYKKARYYTALFFKIKKTSTFTAKISNFFALKNNK
jgi:hypothetical protein